MLRISWLLAVSSLFTLSSGFNLGGAMFMATSASTSISSSGISGLDGVAEYIHKGEKRQATGTGGGASPTSVPPPASSAPPPASSARPPQSSARPPASSAPPPSSAPPAQSSQPPDDSTDAPPASSTPPPAPASSQGQSAAPPRSSANAPAPSSAAAASSTPRTTPVVRTIPQVSTSYQAYVTVIKTVSNGQTVDYTSTGSSAIPITTGEATVTDPPTVQSNGDSGSGVSESNKKVIGGVVGGVGGALLLGGIALVFWRMKKRQHKVSADDDDMTLNTGAALGDKPQNGTGASPFQANLDQYHNPGGRPNAAANF